jgi:signal transduction histidine kinase
LSGERERRGESAKFAWSADQGIRMKYVDKRFLGYNFVLATTAAAILLWISVQASEYAETVGKDLGRATAIAKADRALGNLLETTLDAETGQRGYLLTRKEQYLSDLSAAKEKALADLSDYRGLREVLGELIPPADARLRTEVEAKFTELSETIDLARAGQLDAALEIARADTGAEYMRRIRQTVGDTREKLATERLHYRDELAVTATELGQATKEGTIAVFLLSILGIGAITFHTRQLDRARLELHEANLLLESRVSERTRQLSRSNEEIQRYTHIVSHDLRAPLVNIMGFTRELESAFEALKAYVDAARAGKPFERMKEVYAAVDEDAPEALCFIHSSLTRMDTLIAAILKLSRQGRTTLHPQSIDMRELVEDCLSQIRKRLVESGGEATILPPLPNIVSDADAVKQIFTNLLDNAVKYFARDRAGKITIGGAASGGMAFFEVRDNGRGVAPQDQERIFDLFRRAGAQDQPGEGVGLAHVRALVRRLGGEISVESDGVSGSVFRFSLARNLDTIIDKHATAEK